MMEPPPEISPDDVDQDDDMQSFAAYAEPLFRVTLAGLGGFVSGLAVVRYRRQAPLMSSVEMKVSHPVMHSRRKIIMIPRQTTSSNLPVIWGLSCFAFCGVLEVIRLYKPTELLLSMPEVKESLSGLYPSKSLTPYICTCGDYTFGGAVAGATFRGIQLNASRRQKRSPFSVIKPNMIMGMLSGMALGLLAGVIQVAFDYIGDVLQTEEEPVRPDQVQPTRNDEDLPERPKVN